MLKTKKSEMSISLIVVIVIALIILVVILAIFGKNSGSVAKTLQDCRSRGAECLPKGTTCNGQKIYYVDCPSKDDICCRS